MTQQVMILYKGEHLSQSLFDFGNVSQLWDLENNKGAIERHRLDRPGGYGEDFSKSLEMV